MIKGDTRSLGYSSHGNLTTVQLLGYGAQLDATGCPPSTTRMPLEPADIPVALQAPGSSDMVWAQEFGFSDNLNP